MRHRLHVLVLDGADHAALGDHETQDDARLALFGFQTNVIETARIPQNHEIAMERVFVVNVALSGNDLRAQCILRHAARPAKFNGFDHIAGRAGLHFGCVWFGRFQLRLGLFSRLLRRRGLRRGSGFRHGLKRIGFLWFLRLGLVRWFRFLLRLGLRPGKPERKKNAHQGAGQADAPVKTH